MAYISSFKGQDWLIPQSISDMIPKNHICFFVEEFVESLDFSGFDMINEGQGHPSYHPRILMKVLLQGMLSNERSSRKLANACGENFIFMYLAEKVNPNFRTFCRFRRQNAPFIKDVFKETIKLASKNDLVDLNLICTDGSKIKANASKKKFLKEDQLDSIIDEMIEEDIKRDKREEEVYGDSEINKTSLEAKNLREIVKTYKKSKNKKNVKEICKAAKEEFKKDEIERVSLTDPDCRMMKGKKGNYELAYNTQFTADSKSQIILANDVCQDGVDTNQLQPQIREVKENIELKENTKFAADSNYNKAENLRFLEEENLIGYIPNQAQAQVMNGREQTIYQDDYGYDWGNDEIIIDGTRLKYHATWIHKKGSRQRAYKSEDRRLIKKVPEFFRERLRMKERMETKEGREIYNKRKFVIEPVIGNIKYNYKFDEFLLRGLDGVRLELNLVSIAHNLKKIWIARMRLEDNNKNILFFDFILEIRN